MPCTLRSCFPILLTVLLITCSLGSAAQSGNRFGVKAGASFSNLRGAGEDATDKDLRTAIHGGVFGRVSASDQLGIQAELLYSPKGTTIRYDGLVDQTITFKLAYLELPVFAVVGIGEVLELHAGAYAGYLLSSNASTEGDLGSDDDELDRDNFQGADYGLLLGAGANLGPAQIGLRYLHGLAELAASEGSRMVLGDARNSALQVYLAIALNAK
ncbi:MAG TPA: porin family protein [Flavobacteriales bacterium]